MEKNIFHIYNDNNCAKMKVVMVMCKGRCVGNVFKLLSVLLVLGLSFCFLSFTNNNADALTSHVAGLELSFTSYPTISIQLSTPSDLVIPDLAPGSYADSNHLTVTVNTNAVFGYQLSATVGTKNGTDSLVNTSNSNYTFDNLSSGKSTLASFSDNTWGYSYCYNSPLSDCESHDEYWVYGNRSTSYSGYGALPLDDNTSAGERGRGGVILINTVDYPGTGDSVMFKIGAKASTTQASGNYTNTINFYAVANPEPSLTPVACDPGYICYQSNSLAAVDGTMADQAVAANDQVALRASNFSREGYGFAGWNTDPNYDGVSYGPNETITVPSNISSKGLSLYAMWVPSAGLLQGWTGCSSLDESDVTALRDARDGQVYAVAKLADGNCWTIENLRLDSGNSSGMYASMSQGYSSGFTGLASTEAETNFDDEITTANSLYSATGSTVNTITGNYIAERFPRYHNVNTSSRAASADGNGATFSYGNYYNWVAATATTSETYGNNDSIQSASICPTGWSLPTGGNNGNAANSDFWNLGVAIVGAAPANASTVANSYYTGEPEGQSAIEGFRSFPNNFLFSGIIADGQVRYRGSTGGGYYWSSTYSGPQTAYYVDYNGHNLYPGSSSYYKHLGMAVRCIIHDN